MNFDLQPAISDTLEVGSKTRIGNGLLTAALFQTDTRNEIVTANSSNGRSSYKNADRRGVAAWSWRWISSLVRRGG
ncbi:Outer membrane receptor for monomeric catechols [Serratia rubidaea]|uniref:Outer membrane receptor for monomeric catechols n=1 Tax=Serratia rubidaea TaxID=61652 RepID=A0A3S4FW04_SERRU|nr:Outer membrane receptor for monomeric catechols [Serratia rubidaea]